MDAHYSNSKHGKANDVYHLDYLKDCVHEEKYENQNHDHCSISDLCI